MNLKLIDKLSIITIIVELIWRFTMEKISAPLWMHYVEWGLILLMFLLVILHFCFRSKEEKQNKEH